VDPPRPLRVAGAAPACGQHGGRSSTPKGVAGHAPIVLENKVAQTIGIAYKSGLWMINAPIVLIILNCFN